MNSDAFDEVISYLPLRIRSILEGLTVSIKKNTFELRIRANKPIMLYGQYGMLFVKTDKSSGVFFTDDCLITESNEISMIISSICNYSIYSHQEDIARGFLTFGNGHRAGICGTAVADNGKITTVREIDSLNIRIASYFEVDLPEIITNIKHSDISGIIVCGPPCSGKTTFLRNIAEKCSSSYASGYIKTVVVDERYELGQFAGINCDVLRGFSKYDGIIYGTRVLSPELIICDEICNISEAEEIIRCCNAGIKFVVSMHTENVESVFLRPVGKKLADSGFFNYIVFLDKNKMCNDIEILKTEVAKNEFHRNFNDNDKFSRSCVSNDL